MTIVLAGSPQVELPLRPRMLRVVIENLIANSIRYSGRASGVRSSWETAAVKPARSSS